MQSVQCIKRLNIVYTAAQKLSPSTLAPTIVRCIHTTTPSRQEERPEKLTTTEKLRRKIWGTNEPPVAAEEPVEEDFLEQEYIPDKDARNMLKVGTRGNFMQKEWDALHPVLIYKTRIPSNNELEIETRTRQAVIEVYTKKLASQKTEGDETNTNIAIFTKVLQPKVLFEMVKTKEGDFQFYYSSKAVMRTISRGQHKPATYSTAGRLWRGLALDDVDTKFAILKRVRELTGIIIPDPTISQIKTAEQLYKCLVQNKLKMDFTKTSLAKRLKHPLAQESAHLGHIPNVTIHKHRIRPSDRERAIGRTETIAIIEAGKLRQPGEKKRGMFLRRRRLLGLGIHGVETLPENYRTWDEWKAMMTPEAGEQEGEYLPEEAEEVEEGQAIREGLGKG